MGNKSGKEKNDKKDKEHTDKAKEKPKKSKLASLFEGKGDKQKKDSGPKKKCKKGNKPKGEITGSKNTKKKSLPKKSLTKKNLPKKSLTKKSLPKKSLTKESVTKKNLPKKSLTKESVTKESLPKKSLTKESVTKKSLPKKSLTKESVTKKSLTKKSLPKKSLTKKSVTKKSVTKSDGILKNKTPTVVFVIGGPGSGKGTQCEKAATTFQFTHLSTGDLLRLEVSSGTARGEQVKGIMAKGELVPLETVLTLLQEAIAKVASSSKGFLIDGYPRNVEQGIRFEKEVQPVDCVIYFHVSDETMTQRLLKRGETSGRSDDNEETIKQRLITFHSETQPVIDHYTKQKKVHKIEAEGSVDEIFAKVVAIISKK